MLPVTMQGLTPLGNTRWVAMPLTSELLPFLCGLLLLLWTLPSTLRWIRTWNALRPMTGPSIAVPFWLTIWTYWSKRHKTTRDATTEFFKLIREMSSTYKGQNYRGYVGMAPVVVLQTPEAIEKLLGNKKNLRKPFMYDFLKPLMGSQNMLTITGEVWQKKRRLTAPYFHLKNSGNFLAPFNAEANIMIQDVEKAAAENGRVAINKCLKYIGLKCIIEACMGVPLKPDEVRQLAASMHLIEFNVIARAIRPWTWSQTFYDMTREGKWFKEMGHIARRICDEAAEERKTASCRMTIVDDSGAQPEERNRHAPRPFVDILLEKHSEDSSYTATDITDDLTLLLFAGYETTTVGMMLCLYLVALHPEVQRRVHEEVDAIFGDDDSRDVTAEDAEKMTYLECCLKEALRLVPPVPCIARALDNELEIDGFVIPRGVLCAVDIYSLHRNETYFHDPEKFIPDRFMDKKEKQWHSYAYIPFSAGPKNCIGQKFSYLESKVVLSKLFRKFWFKAEKPLEEIKLTAEVVVKVKGELYVTAARR